MFKLLVIVSILSLTSAIEFDLDYGININQRQVDSSQETVVGGGGSGGFNPIGAVRGFMKKGMECVTNMFSGLKGGVKSQGLGKAQQGGSKDKDAANTDAKMVPQIRMTRGLSKAQIRENVIGQVQTRMTRGISQDQIRTQNIVGQIQSRMTRDLKDLDEKLKEIRQRLSQIRKPNPGGPVQTRMTRSIITKYDDNQDQIRTQKIVGQIQSRMTRDLDEKLKEIRQRLSHVRKQNPGGPVQTRMTRDLDEKLKEIRQRLSHVRKPNPGGPVQTRMTR